MRDTNSNYTRKRKRSSSGRPAPKRARMMYPSLAGLGIEMKYYDTSRTGATIATSGDATGGEVDPTTVNTISAPAQGAGEQERIGKAITLKKIIVTGTVLVPAQTNQTATDTNGLIYVAVVWDKQTNAAQLDSEKVWTNPTTSAVTNTNMLRNLDFGKRFKVLRGVILQPQVQPVSWDGTNIEQQGTTTPFQFYIKFPKGLKINFNATTTAGVASVIDHSFHICAFASQSANGALLAYNARIRYEG